MKSPAGEGTSQGGSAGDPTLFVREDAVDAAWRVVEPVLGETTGVRPYVSGTWGPAEADRLVANDGGWYTPTLDLAV